MNSSRPKSQGITYWRQRVRREPDSARAHCGLGVELGNAGRHEESVAAHRRAIGLASGWPDLWCGLGAALCNLDEMQEGKAALRRCLRIQPDHAMARLNLGLACAETGRIKEAQEHLNRYCQLAPCDAEPLSEDEARRNVAANLLSFAEDHNDLKAPRRARQLARLSLEYEESVDGLLTAADFLSLDHRRAALKLYERADMLAPEDPRALAAMADVCLLLGWRRKAMSYVERGLSLPRRPGPRRKHRVWPWDIAEEDLYVSKAFLAWSDGDRQGAFAAIDEGLRRFKNSEWLRRWRGRLEEEAQREQDGQEGSENGAAQRQGDNA